MSYPKAVASASWYITLLLIKISPTDKLSSKAPAEPVFIINVGLNFSINSVVEIAAFTFPIPLVLRQHLYYLVAHDKILHVLLQSHLNSLIYVLKSYFFFHSSNNSNHIYTSTLILAHVILTHNF